MAERQSRTQGSSRGSNYAGVTKQRKGIQVGRALPEGPQRRKVQQVKRQMIENAKLKKQYAKLKGRDNDNQTQEGRNVPHLGESHVSPGPSDEEPPPQERLEDVSEVEWGEEDDQNIEDDAEPVQEKDTRKGPTVEDELARNRYKKTKQSPFIREEREADRRKKEIDERREAREKANRERIQKIEERERFRKAMAKARTGGKNGQRKLGRESQVLLERVQRMMGK